MKVRKTMIHPSDCASVCSTSESGSALLAALTVVMTVAGLSAITMQLNVSSLREQQMSNDRKKAFYVAEAGLSEAVLSIRMNGSGHIGTQAEPSMFGEGFVFTKSLEDAYGNVLLTSTGIVGRARHQLALAMEKQVIAAGGLGFFGANSLVVGGGTQIDMIAPPAGAIAGAGGLGGGAGGMMPLQMLGGGGFGGGVLADSGNVLDFTFSLPPDLIPIPKLPSDIAAKVGSNLDASIETALGPTATTITGDLTLGPAATLTLGLGVNVTGATAPLDEPSVVPEISPPVKTSTGNFNVPATTILPIPAANAGYDSITVEAGATLTIAGPAEITADSFELKSGATLEIDSSAGPVDIYVQNALTLHPGCFVDELAFDAAGLALVALDTGAASATVTFEPSGTFYGLLYAPESDVTIPNTVEVFGAVVANNLTVAPDTVLHFDTAAAHSRVAQVNFVPKSWNIDEVPAAVKNPLNYNPAQDVALGMFIPEMMGNDHKPIDEVVEWTDASGDEFTYRGPTGGLDMAQVAVVIRTTLSTDPDFAEESIPTGIVIQF